MMKANKDLNSLVTKYSISLVLLIFIEIVVTKFDALFYKPKEINTVIYLLLNSGVWFTLISNIIVAILLTIDLHKRKLFLIWIILVTLFFKELGVIFALIYLLYNDKKTDSLHTSAHT